MTTKYFKHDPRKAPHLYDDKLSVRNWRSQYKAKYGSFIAPSNAKMIELFIERLLLNTIKESRTGNLDEMMDVV
jgi:hypothetical protein